MKRPVLKLAALAIVVYIATLLALFPASLALRWFLPAIPGLVVGPASGTIWDGSVTGIEYAGWNPGRATWKLDPFALLTLRAAADMHVDRGNAAPIRFSVSAGLAGDVDISNLQATLTLADLERARVMPRNIASGEILLNLPRLELVDGRPVAAEGRVSLAGLQSAFLPGVALGSYEGELKTTETGITATFRDAEAPLGVTGQAQLQPDGRYSASGSITPRSETPEGLRRGLGLLGQPDASGRYSFSFNGQL